MYLTDGIRTGRKINGWMITGLWGSVGLGIVGLVFVLVSGIYQWAKLKQMFVFRPVFAAFCAVLFLFVPVPFFLSQPFVAMGNQNAASVLLMLATVFLPVGISISAARFWKSRPQSPLQKMDAIALLFVFQ